MAKTLLDYNASVVTPITNGLLTGSPSLFLFLRLVYRLQEHRCISIPQFQDISPIRWN